MKNRRVPLDNLMSLILCQIPAEIGYIITMEVGHDETGDKRRCVDLVPNPVDRVTPIQYRGTFAIGPAVGHGVRAWKSWTMKLFPEKKTNWASRHKTRQTRNKSVGGAQQLQVEVKAGGNQVGILEDTVTQLGWKGCLGRRYRFRRPWGGTAGLENGFFGELLEWTVPFFAKPYMTVFETWGESDRGDSKLTYVE
ncbi:hypothetical protein VTI74DRAFT_8792 [Chaetomium olivicolor]